VEVNDSGKGIPPDLIQQVKSGIVFLKDANNEKSGFGLQIMHKIATYLDVGLSIVSSDQGTKIQFTFKTT
jgi:sensor histidine kinase regulating citrate/malate metabolism